tara:strand:- start:1534 stop:3303 length:1770 start_codon:yes stop_codon:yes gene_type:complete
MKLYINLFKEINPKKLTPTIEDSVDSYYLDFHGRLLEEGSTNNISLEELENYKINYTNAVKSYTSFIVKLSTITIDNKHIRSFTFNGLPLFWLTSISEKHYFHWLMKIMLLREILADNISFFKEYTEIVILIPSQLKDVKLLLKEVFSPYNIPFNFFDIREPIHSNVTLTLFKISLKTIFLFFKMKSPELTYDLHSITFLLTGKITDYTKNFFTNIHKIIEQGKDTISQVPLYYWTNPLVQLEYKVPYLFWETRLSLFTLIKIFYTQFKTLHSIRNIDRSKNIKVNNISFPASLLIQEIECVFIQKNNSLLMSYWLNAYKKTLAHKTKFFYEDEFYPAGRAISFGLKDTETFGVQHSMIVKNHTVYHISDVEWKPSDQNMNDGLPLPSNFIVWGQYFKTQFLSFNSLKDNFIYIAGNPTYINRSVNVTTTKSNIPEVLYCLTTPDIFSKEKKIIKDTLDAIPQLRLKVRYHPLWEFDKDLVLDFFKNLNISFSNEKNIFNDINKSTFVITGSHSGVWLDSIVANKPVVRLITSFQDDIEQNNLMYNVGNEKEMKNSIQLILKENKSTLKNDLLYLKNDRWVKLLEKTNA